ncbi:glycosyltransferase family 39 protein [Candidatus Roizmanbacteria bacterium]|nr:glycosyltransferase family 39 protein [Candidatus Roizmanbacteria bacterium]
MQNKKLNSFFLILSGILSLVLIFYKFNLIPKNLAFDEVEFTKLALSLDKKPYIPYSQLATGHSTLYFYILLASLKTFGVNTFALRFPAAIFGILSVIAFYLIMKRVSQQFNNRTMKQWFPFFQTFILLSSHWFLNFARFSFEATFLLFLELMSIYFLLRCIDTSKYLHLILSGIFSGLAFNSYTPGRIFFLLPLGFLILKKLRKSNNEIMKQLLLFLIPFIIMVTPLTLYLSTHTDTRIDQQFFLMNHEMPIQEKLNGLWHNVSSTALMFNIKGDVNGRHNYPNKPALNPTLGILFIIGLIISIKNYKNLYNNLFLLYFLISLFPALMTYPWENPNMLRTFTVLPSVFYFISNAIIILWTTVLKIFPNKKKIVFCFLFLVILFSSFYELRTYFKYQSSVFKQSFEIKLPLEKAIKVKTLL